MQWILKPRLLEQLTSSTLSSSCLVVGSLWNKNPTSWWILVLLTSHLLDFRISYNAINFGMRKKSSHLLLLCSCSTSLLQFVSTWWAMDACYIQTNKQTRKQTNALLPKTEIQQIKCQINVILQIPNVQNEFHSTTRLSCTKWIVLQVKVSLRCSNYT